MNTVPPDYKSSALPLGHARLVPQDPLNRLLQFLFLIYLLVTSYCFIIVAVVIVLGLGAFFLLCVLSKTIEPLNLRPYKNCHTSTEINTTFPCSQTQISTPGPILLDLNLICNKMCQKHNENSRVSQIIKFLMCSVLKLVTAVISHTSPSTIFCHFKN